MLSLHCSLPEPPFFRAGSELSGARQRRILLRAYRDRARSVEMAFSLADIDVIRCYRDDLSRR